MEQPSNPKSYLLQGPVVIRIPEEDIPYTFFTSDIHRGHKNILNFTKRGEVYNDVDAMNEGLLLNIAETLKPCQTGRTNGHKVRFIHCGDLIFGSKGQVANNLATIQNAVDLYADEVYAIFGNHDVDNILRYCELIPAYGFTCTNAPCNTKWFWNTMFIIEIIRNNGSILKFSVSHFPMEEYHGSFNIHGHLHSEPVVSETANNKSIILKYRNTGFHFDCGVDNNNLRPVSLADILEGKTSININQMTSVLKRNFQYADPRKS